MSFITNLYTSFNTIENKKFYRYLLIFLSIVLLLSAGIIFLYYRAGRTLKKDMNKVIEYRRQAEEILNRAQEVKQQREEVDMLLEQEPFFQIGGYFENILGSLNIQKAVTKTENVELNESYSEDSLTAQFVNINMKDLTMLLATIEANPRISTKELDIKRSEKVPGTIDVTLVIATLLPNTTTV